MKIAYLVAGSGNRFYCENCDRDITLIRSMRSRGHDAVILPLYLPIQGNLPSVPLKPPVFYPAVNIYLEEKLPFYRRIPQCFKNIFNLPLFLRIAAERSGSTSAQGLEEMTISMLESREQVYLNELDRLTGWLTDNFKPDIIHLSNALLSGVAAGIKAKTGVPVVLSLQDEDQWIDPMDPPYRKRIWEKIYSHSKAIDAYAAVSRYYLEYFVSHSQVSREKVHLIYPGIPLEDISRSPSRSSAIGPVLGYLSRISEENGIGRLARAFISLKKSCFPTLQLKICGGITDNDKKYFQSVLADIRKHGFYDDVEVYERFDAESRRLFIREVDVVSVPFWKGEALGLFILEAFAEGTPVVVPDSGGFGELIEQTTGGLSYEPSSPIGLDEALLSVLESKELYDKLSGHALSAVRDFFNADRYAEQMEALYLELIKTCQSKG